MTMLLIDEVLLSNERRMTEEQLYMWQDADGVTRIGDEMTAPMPQEPETSIWQDIGSAFNEAGEQLYSFGVGGAHGVEKGLTNMLQIPIPEGLTFADGRPVATVSDFAEWVGEETGTNFPLPEKPEGIAAGIGEGLGQFAIGWAPASRILRMAGLFNRKNLLNRVSRETVAGAVGDFGTSSDEEAEALLSMLSMIPEEYGGGVAKDVSQTLTDWMQGDDGNTDELKGRLIASIPGAVLTGPLEALAELAGVAWKSGKGARQQFARLVKSWCENPQPLQGMYTGIPIGIGHNRPPPDMRLEVETPEPPRTDIDEEGFYSAARRAAENLPDKGSPREMLALLKNPQKVGENVKDAELKWTGLDQLLADPDRKSITREEILSHLDSHQVRVHTENVGDQKSLENWEGLNFGDPEPDMEYGSDYIRSRVDDDMAEIGETYQGELGYPWVGVRPELEKLGWTPEQLDAIEAHLLEHGELPEDGIEGVAKLQDNVYDILTEQEEQAYRDDPIWQTWSTDEGYEISGGDDVGYRVTNPMGIGISEHVLDFDVAVQQANLDAAEEGIGGAPQDLFEEWTVRAGKDTAENYRVMTINLDDVEQSPVVTSSRDFGETGGGHFEGDHQLLHIRMTDNVVDGKNTLFIQEIQSDAQRKLKRRRNVNIAGQGLPFLTDDHKDYAGLAVKKIIALATQEGYERVAWTTGAQQADVYNLSKFIDRIELSPGGNLRAYDKNEREILSQTGVDDARLDEILGKANADRLRAVEPVQEIDISDKRTRLLELDEIAKKKMEEAIALGSRRRTLSDPRDIATHHLDGELRDEYFRLHKEVYERPQPGSRILESADIEIGGEFHKMLYDKITPKEFKSALKKYQKKPKVRRGSLLPEVKPQRLGEATASTLRRRAQRIREHGPQPGVIVDDPGYRPELQNRAQVADELDRIANIVEDYWNQPGATIDGAPTVADVIPVNLNLLSDVDQVFRDVLDTIPEYNPPPTAEEIKLGQVHYVDLDKATRKKIKDRGISMFTVPAAVAGAAAGGASLVSSPSEAAGTGMSITIDQPAEIGEGAFDPENPPPGYVIKGDKAVSVKRRRRK